MVPPDDTPGPRAEAPAEREYRWIHHAYEVDPSALAGCLTALRQYLSSADEGALAALCTRMDHRWRQACWTRFERVHAVDAREQLRATQRVLERERARLLAHPDDLAAAQSALAAAAESVLRAPALEVRRTSWEGMIRSRARLDRLIALQAPEVFVANECELLACVAASILPDGSSIEPRDATYERTSASGADERALSGPDLWHLLDDVARWTRDPFAANRGLGTALERLPHHAAFVAAHAEVWPSDMTFWQVHAYEPDPAWAARAQDVYTDRALWRPAAVCFTDDALPPDDAWHPDVRALFRAGERVGVGESGGPLTVASGPALAAHARRLRELAADAGAAAPWVDAVRALAERCDEAAARGATWVCYVQLDAPPP